MADISKCKGTDCPMKDNCYRYTANESYLQSWFTEVPILNGKCDEYWDNKGRYKA